MLVPLALERIIFNTGDLFRRAAQTIDVKHKVFIGLAFVYPEVAIGFPDSLPVQLLELVHTNYRAVLVKKTVQVSPRTQPPDQNML